MDSTLSSTFAVSNYIAENRDVALQVKYKGSTIGEWLKLSPLSEDGKYQDAPISSINEKTELKAVSKFISTNVENTEKAKLQFRYLLERDPIAYLEKIRNQVVSALDPNSNLLVKPDDKATMAKACGLLLLAGKLPDTGSLSAEEGNKLIMSEFNKLSLGSLYAAVELEAAKPEPPVAALALFVGADKPWVKKRFEQSTHLGTWSDLVANNFNVSPKVLLAGMVKFQSMEPDNPKLLELKETLWKRPDFQGYMKTRLAAVELDPSSAHEDLKNFALLGVENGNSDEALTKLYVELKKYSPSEGLVTSYKSEGMSEGQAELRAAFLRDAQERSAYEIYNSSARRFLAAATAPSEVVAEAPSCMGLFSRAVQRITGKIRSLIGVPDSSYVDAGYTSWEHKDQIIENVEAELLLPRNVTVNVGVQDNSPSVS